MNFKQHFQWNPLARKQFPDSIGKRLDMHSPTNTALNKDTKVPTKLLNGITKALAETSVTYPLRH